MTAGRDVDRLLWAIAEARRLRTEGPVHPMTDLGTWGRDTNLPENQFATDWQQPAAGRRAS